MKKGNRDGLYRLTMNIPMPLVRAMVKASVSAGAPTLSQWIRTLLAEASGENPDDFAVRRGRPPAKRKP